MNTLYMHCVKYLHWIEYTYIELNWIYTHWIEYMYWIKYTCIEVQCQLLTDIYF